MDKRVQLFVYDTEVDMARHPGGRTCNDIFQPMFWLMLPLRFVFYHITGRRLGERREGPR